LRQPLQGGQVLVLLPLLTTAITPATHKHQTGVRVTTTDDNSVLLRQEVAGMGESAGVSVTVKDSKKPTFKEGPYCTSKQHKALDNALKAKSMKRRAVKPDGHCFFYCAQIALAQHGIRITIPALRDKLCTHLAIMLREYGEGADRAYLIDGAGTVKQYMTAMRKCEWADEPIISALALLFQCTVRLWSAETASIFNEYKNENLSVASLFCIDVAWVNTRQKGCLNHFELVISTTARASTPKERQEAPSLQYSQRCTNATSQRVQKYSQRCTNAISQPTQSYAQRCAKATSFETDTVASSQA
jgi:hypothetical protein